MRNLDSGEKERGKRKDCGKRALWVGKQYIPLEKAKKCDMNKCGAYYLLFLGFGRLIYSWGISKEHIRIGSVILT